MLEVSRDLIVNSNSKKKQALLVHLFILQEKFPYAEILPLLFFLKLMRIQRYLSLFFSVLLAFFSLLFFFCFPIITFLQ